MPVPSPERIAPAGARIPLADDIAVYTMIGKRLLGSMAGGWLSPLIESRRHPYPMALTDTHVLDLFFNTIFSRFITTDLTAEDAANFEPFLTTRQPDESDFKIDFSAVSRIHTLPALNTAPTVTLGRIAADGTPRFLAMRINGLTLTPQDGNAWVLARYFLMQGAGIHSVLVHHTPTHFQFDAVNAISTSVLPPNHLLLRLLRPHFQFTLSLNKAALHSRLSILTSDQAPAHSTLPGDEASAHPLQAGGGSEEAENQVYPAYRFPRRPPPVFGKLGRFLDIYYAEILRFTRGVLAAVPADDPHVLRWADEVSAWVPGFPDPTEIQVPGVLAEIAAYCIWGTTVAHSTEHYGLSEEIPLRSIPLWLRVPPPASRDIPPVNRRSLTTSGDMFRQRVAWEWLVRDHSVTRLYDVRYDFAAPDLRRAAADFRKGLRDIDTSLRVRRFVPLRRIARSIQT